MKRKTIEVSFVLAPVAAKNDSPALECVTIKVLLVTALVGRYLEAALVRLKTVDHLEASHGPRPGLGLTRMIPMV